MRLDLIVLALVFVLIVHEVWGVHYDDAQPDDMTTWVTVTQSSWGSWIFTNTSDKNLRCNLGLTEYPRWSTSVEPKSPSLSVKDSTVRIAGTNGNRNFDLEPYDSFVYDRPNVGTIYCEHVK